MACYHPLKAFQVGVNPLTGKKVMKITSYQVDGVYQLSPGESWYCFSGSPPLPVFRYLKDFTEVACGQCVGCRLERSRQWANRLLMELEYHDSAYFVTLTYDDDHVPLAPYSDPDTGEAFFAMSLMKRDFQLFMKRLRFSFSDDSIRFFASGEYGPSTLRPHYHAIIFGLHLPDLVVSGASPLGDRYYTSASLQRVWSSPPRDRLNRPAGQASLSSREIAALSTPTGFITIAPVTWESCAYTARYIMKKLNGKEADYYTSFNIEPPFSLMSRRPGIARQWYDDHPGCMDFEYISISTPTGGKKFRPPRYFMKMFEVDYPEESEKIKAIRKRMAAAAKAAKLRDTSLDYLELLSVEEHGLNDRINKLDVGRKL